jgi:TRAP-type C4-dicarboxylate transport system permease small subunit
MKATFINKLSTYVFAALMVLTAVVLGLFFFVGYDNYTTLNGSSVVDPQFTDLLMYWMYALVAAGIICVVLFVFADFISLLKNEPSKAIKTVVALVLIVALFGGAYALASDAPIRMADNTLFDDKASLILSDVCIYVQYVLLIASVALTIVGFFGVFKALNKVKA